MRDGRTGASPLQVQQCGVNKLDNMGWDVRVSRPKSGEGLCLLPRKKRTFPFEMACLAHFERAGVEIALMKQRDDLMRVMKLRVMVILGLPIVQVIETAYKSLI